MVATAPRASTQTVGEQPDPTPSVAARGSDLSPYYELDNTGALPLGIESGISLGLFLGITFGFQNPDECKWCTPPGFDVSIRDALVWDNRTLAANIADGMAVATGAGALAAVIVPALVDADAKDIWALEDSLIVINATLIDLAVTDLLKDVIARQRPAFYFGESHRTSPGQGANKSFPSGHTSLAFAAASSAATVSFLRGYSSAPYIAAGGGTLALGTGLFRIFADKHWATDVITGAVLGSAIGISMPVLLHGRGDSAENTTTQARSFTLSVQPLETGGAQVISFGGTW